MNMGCSQSTTDTVKPCENCPACGGFPGYGPSCDYWAHKRLAATIGTGIKNTFTPTGDVKKDTERANRFADMVGMDSNNRKAGVVLATRVSP
jgi:hypothetical protein